MPLVPINALPAEQLRELASKAHIRKFPAGKTLFNLGDTDGRTLYVCQGVIEMSAPDKPATRVQGGTDKARLPLGHHQPRQLTCKALTDVSIIDVDSALLDVMLTWDQSAGLEVDDLDNDEDDWMARLLQSETFRHLPPANIQKLFMKMEQIKTEKGDLIIKQDDEGDYYYIIIEGTCRVSRFTPRTNTEIPLAEIGAGDSFGEEALISDNRRNANVTMSSDGVLMRLAKTDFLDLMREPLQKWVSMEEAKILVQDGARWIDVRLPSEYNAGHIKDAENIPLFFLRRKSVELDTATRYIVYCDTGARSSAAAFLLSERGFDTAVLEGGYLSVDQSDAA